MPTSPTTGLSATVRIEAGGKYLLYQVDVPRSIAIEREEDARHVRQVLGAGVLMGIALLDGKYTETEDEK